MKHRIQQGFTLIELLVVITIIAILASLAVPTFSKIQEKGNQTKAISNCRQIITTLRLYSSDNNGNYPDADSASMPTTSNGAFRVLAINGIADNEMIFGCPASLDGNPDGNIGTAPQYTEFLQAGKKENHWAMAGGLNDSASGSYPLVWEAATDTAYDPSWDASAAGKNVKGRTWSGGKVIIGMNDSSVSTQKCVAATGSAVHLANLGGSSGGSGGGGSSVNLFTQNTQSGSTPPKVLDVE